jgi:hypothetical protein
MRTSGFILTRKRTISMDKWKAYWRFSGERALKTAVQAAISVIGVDTMGILSVNWLNVLSVSIMAAIMSLLTSILTYDKKAGK